DTWAWREESLGGGISPAASSINVSVRHGRKWVDPDLLRHLAMAEPPSQIANGLTSREAEIAHLVSRGLRNKEIAHELQLSEGTVKMCLHHIYDKLRLGVSRGRRMRHDETAGL